MARNKRAPRAPRVRKWIRRLRWVRRGVLLAGMAGGVIAGKRTLGGGPTSTPTPASTPGSGRSAATTTSTTSRTPATSANSSAPVRSLAAVPDRHDEPASDTSKSAVTWVEPIDGECPDGYPIKANANSMIYHLPGGRFYSRTHAERCYADAADAEADGFRPAKGAGA